MDEDRVLVIDEGVIVPGQEERAKKLIEEEMARLKEIWASMVKDDPSISDMEPKDWYKDAFDSLVGASYRFGTGKVYGKVK